MSDLPPRAPVSRARLPSDADDFFQVLNSPDRRMSVHLTEPLGLPPLAPTTLSSAVPPPPPSPSSPPLRSRVATMRMEDIFGSFSAQATDPPPASSDAPANEPTTISSSLRLPRRPSMLSAESARRRSVAFAGLARAMMGFGFEPSSSPDHLPNSTSSVTSDFAVLSDDEDDDDDDDDPLETDSSLSGSSPLGHVNDIELVEQDDYVNDDELAPTESILLPSTTSVNPVNIPRTLESYAPPTRRRRDGFERSAAVEETTQMTNKPKKRKLPFLLRIFLSKSSAQETSIGPLLKKRPLDDPRRQARNYTSAMASPFSPGSSSSPQRLTPETQRLASSKRLMDRVVVKGRQTTIPPHLFSRPPAPFGYEIHCQTIASEDLQLMTLLEDEGRDVNSLDPFNRSILHYAVLMNELDILKYVLAQFREIRFRVIGQIDNASKSPLGLAMVLGRVKCVRELMAFGRASTSVESLMLQKIRMEEVSSAIQIELGRCLENSESVIEFLVSLGRNSDHDDDSEEEEEEGEEEDTFNPRHALDELKKIVRTARPDLSYQSSLLGSKLTPIGACLMKPGRKLLLEYLLENHALIEKDTINFDSIPEEYRLTLTRHLRRQKRENVLLEMLSTEKTYVDDLRIAIRLFYRKSNIKRLIARKHRGAGLVRLQSIGLTPFRSLESIYRCHKDLVWKLNDASMTLPAESEGSLFNEADDADSPDILSLRRWCDGETMLGELLKTIDLSEDFYCEYTRSYNTLESHLKSNPSFSLLGHYLQTRASLIPLPKVQILSSALAKPRIRLVKFRDLSSRIARSCKGEEEEELRQMAIAVTDKVTNLLFKMDRIVGEILENRKLRSIAKIWEDQFGTSRTFLEENVPLPSSFPLPRRQYLCHATGVACWNLKVRVGDAKGLSANKDVYFFSDSIWVGSLSTRSLGACFFHDTRSVITFAEETFRLTIFNRKSEKIVDLQFLLPSSALWFSTLSDFFTDVAKVGTYYSSRVLIISRFGERSRVSDFLGLEWEEDETEELKGAPGREGGEIKLDVVTMELNQLRREIAALEERKRVLEGLWESESKARAEEGEEEEEAVEIEEEEFEGREMPNVTPLSPSTAEEYVYVQRNPLPKSPLIVRNGGVVSVQ